MDKHKALIEAVAQAICENSGGTWRKGEYPIASGENFEVEYHDLDKVNNHWRYAATAALNAVYEALKEPSDQMHDAAAELGVYKNARRVWQDMLSVSALSASSIQGED